MCNCKQEQELIATNKFVQGNSGYRYSSDVSSAHFMRWGYSEITIRPLRANGEIAKHNRSMATHWIVCPYCGDKLAPDKQEE